MLIIFYFYALAFRRLNALEHLSFFFQSRMSVGHISVPEAVVAADGMREILEGKLTLRATRTEPTSVAVAELGRRGRATIVDARALNTAVRVVHALLLKFAPRAMVETVAPAPA